MKIKRDTLIAYSLLAPAFLLVAGGIPLAASTQ